MKIVTRAIIINDQGKVLLGKRARNDAIGKWALVGGKPDIEEIAEDAVVREVQEELGLSFKPTLWIEEVDATFGQGEEWKVYYFYGPAEGVLNMKQLLPTKKFWKSKKYLLKLISPTILMPFTS